ALILCMLVLEQLPMTSAGKAILWAVAGISLLLLAVINFFLVWVLLGIIGFVVLVFSMTRQRFTPTQLSIDGKAKNEGGVVLLAAAITVVSVLFVIMGSSLGAWINNLTGISYVEVRPSVEATVNIARSVLQADPAIGVGPNKFVDAWRQYRDPSINETIFWNTPFLSGSSYLTTSIVELGVLGFIAWMTFLGWLLVSGFRMLSASTNSDRFWRFVGISAFIATLYYWTMAALYAPGAATLLLAAVCTGVFLVAYSTIVPVRSVTISAVRNRNLAFVFVAVVMVIIVIAISATYLVVQNAQSVYSFNKALNSVEPGDTIEELEITIASLYNRTSNDAFAQRGR
ncbi:MAG: hypothetical protein AAFO91_17930, partial [Bacteroidota bacterium]